MADIQTLDYQNYTDEELENFSITDGLQDLMGGGGIEGLLGGQLDINKMMPQLLMGLLSKNSRGNDISQMLSGFQNIGNNYDQSYLNHHKEYDEHIKVKGIGHLKACIPYLDPSMQRHFAVYIKLLELQGVVGYYTKNTLPYVVREGDWQRNMLQSMRHFSDNGGQYEKMLRAFDMYSMFKGFGGKNEY